MTNFHRLGPFHQLFDEFIVDSLVHDQPRRRGAFLASAAKRPAKGKADGQIDIGVIHHGQRVLRPHFHLDLGKVLHCGGGDAAPYRHRPRE